MPVPCDLTTRSGDPLTFRALESQDIDAVMALERLVQTHPWRRSSYEDCLNGRHHCWLAEHGGELVGFAVASWGGGDAELLNLAVTPKWQRRGVGQCLLTQVCEKLSAYASMVFLEVRVSNRRAIEFYQRQQFFEVGNRPNYYPTMNGREDALIMALQL